MSFLLSVTNPNSYPILLEGVTFTVAFDNDFELYSGNNNDSYWIPAGKTSHVRLNTMITTQSAFMSVGVTGGYNLKDKGWGPWDAIQAMVGRGSYDEGSRDPQGMQFHLQSGRVH